MSYVACVDNSIFGTVATDAVTLGGDQTIDGTKTFSVPILSPTPATQPDELINYSQIENLVLLNGGDQTIFGAVTFDVIPTTLDNPSNPDDLVKYSYLQEAYISRVEDTTVTSTFSFATPPICATEPTTDPELVNKQYMDALPTTYGTSNNYSLSLADTPSGDTVTILDEVVSGVGNYILNTVINMQPVTTGDTLTSTVINVYVDGTLTLTGGYSVGNAGVKFLGFPNICSFYGEAGYHVVIEVSAVVSDAGNSYTIPADQTSFATITRLSGPVV
jgi:hypothetical protein